MFIDKCLIELKAGNGGDGIVSWRREAHYPEGGPWGGNGGNGGNIYLIGDHNENSLFELRYIKKISAENGGKGGNKLCHGANGNDSFVKVPLGTSVHDVDKDVIIVDITKHGQKYLLCVGGKGGYGNAHFKSSFNKTPKLFEKGDIGTRKKIFLEMKYLSDVGILGLPNAGKSTLISVVSSAKPKIAPYKFTTINPVLGSVEYNNQKIIFADIPGLIEGAADGVGLGLEFLRHVERCTILIHLISGSFVDNESSVESYEVVNKEIKKYNLDINKKTIFVAVSKQDEDGFDQLYQELQDYLPNQKIYKINSLLEYPKELIEDIFIEYSRHIQKMNLIPILDDEDEHLFISLEKEEEDELEITKLEDNIWEIKSKKITYWGNKIPLITDDNIVRFEQKINLNDIAEKVKKNGAKNTDTMIINDEEYTVG